MSFVGQKESESASPWYVFLIFLHQSSSPCSPLTQHLSCSVTLVDITSDHDVNVEILSSAPRPERWIVTIPSFDQWLATIEKPSSPMVARPKTIAKPSSPMVARLKKHRGQWLIDQKPLKNHWYQWFLPNHSFNGNGDPENH